MNANEVSPKTNPRLNRIKIVSRIVRYVVLANLVFTACYFVLGFPGFKFGFPVVSVRSFLNILLAVFVCCWLWELARLFRFYEHGLIFGAATIRCIKILGIICLCGWLTMVALHFTPRPAMQFPESHPGTQVVVNRTDRNEFFSFHFGTNIDFGLLFVGASIVVAAWIMDEGRKIQEEQELTV